MTEPKVDPATLALRAPPRPVTRLNRRTLTLVIGVLAAAVLGATVWSLQAGRGTPRELPTQLHNVDRLTRAEGLDQLPQDYSKLSNPTLAATTPMPPLLGPPLPGDLGGPILRAERQGAIDATVPGSASTSLRADPYQDAARVERLNRQREAEEAAKAPLFFRGSARKEGAPASVLSAATGPQPITPESPTAASNATGSTNQTNGQNLQDQKRAFVDRTSDAATRSTHALLSPVSPYQVMAGTIIPAALVTGINSDLPGQVIATVTEAVYDSATGRHLLIPQGSRLLGQYDSQVAFGQRRVLLVWTRLVLPDSSSMTLDRLPGVDPAGHTGLEDDVDWHWKQLLAGAALSTLIGVGAELAAPDRSNGQSQVVVATRGSLQDSINQVGQELTRRNLNVQPTLTIRPGFPVRVIVNKDLVLRPYQPLFFEKTER
jgi:type IV secretory pathway VirB10-like protein